MNWKKVAIIASAASIVGTGLMVMFIKGAHTHEDPSPEELYEKMNLHPDRFYILFKNSDKSRIEVDTKGMRSVRNRGNEDVAALRDWPEKNYAIGVGQTNDGGMILLFFKTDEDKSYFTYNVEGLFKKYEKAEGIYYLNAELDYRNFMSSGETSPVLMRAPILYMDICKLDDDAVIGFDAINQHFDTISLTTGYIVSSEPLDNLSVGH